jgi:tRNA-specific 2-thiouridylase
MNRKVLCGMSGGVDSSVTAYLLREQGYQVAGCTMRLFDNEDIGQGQESSCCSLNDVEDAKQVCYKLGLPHYVFHFAKEFRRDVMCPFARAYLEGRTPNPCIDCNRHLKFGRLVIRAAEVEMRYVATGHYARITRQGDRWLLQKSVDRKKDQTYFLYHLTQQQMDHFLMPLGELTKEEVRGIAAEQGFSNARKRDSQDICFVPNGDYGAFIERFTGIQVPPGAYIDRNGTVLGTHRGHIRYTLGQRKGLEISLGKRAYVVGKNVAENTVTLGEDRELYGRALTAQDLNLIACERIDGTLHCTAKTRHTQYETPCTVIQPEPDELLIRFKEPVRAISPGQSVVLYDGETVIGGGTIVQATS